MNMLISKFLILKITLLDLFLKRDLYSMFTFTYLFSEKPPNKFLLLVITSDCNLPTALEGHVMSTNLNL